MANNAYVHKPFSKPSGVVTRSSPDVRSLESKTSSISGVRNIRMPIDASMGHCFPPTVPTSGSITTFTDQFAQVRVSDGYMIHCCGPVCHVPAAAQGSITTYADQLAKHCSTHAMSCGDFAANGSMDSLAGY